MVLFLLLALLVVCLLRSIRIWKLFNSGRCQWLPFHVEHSTQ